MGFAIAIDGPAAAGKSTVSKIIADRMEFVHIDTGAMYRAMGLFLLQEGIDTKDKEAVSKECLKPVISIDFKDGKQIVRVGGMNVTNLIRTEAVSQAASDIATVSEVRRVLVTQQRKIAETRDVVMDGRDICTSVLPNAQVKIYLDAPRDIRAGRRYLELTEKGIECDLEQVKRDMEQRDYQDMNREISPLHKAVDAYYIDTGFMSAEEAAGQILKIAYNIRFHRI